MNTPLEFLKNTVKEKEEKTFLVASDATYTYGEFDKITDSFAKVLIKNGIKKGDAVLARLARDSAFLISYFGVLKAGGVFIPIGMSYPDGRIQNISANSKAVCLIQRGIGNSSFDMKLGIFDYDQLDDQRKDIDENIPLPALAPEDPAIMLYTSGSTGTPKGILLSHQSLVGQGIKDETNLFVYNCSKKGHVLMSITTVTFIVAYLEYTAIISAGLTLVFSGENASQDPLVLADLGEKYGVDVIVATPSRINQYMDVPAFAKLVKKCTLMGLAGERMPKKLFERIASCSDCLVINMYGMSECGGAFLFGLLNSDTSGACKPFREWECIIVDDEYKKVPLGDSGMLCIRSKNLMLGYVNLPEETKKKNVTINGKSFFNTGDVAKVTADGSILIVGRADHQIKLRGLRIEPGEIEAVITGFEDALILKSVVKVNKISGIENLVAYFVSKDHVDTNKLKEHLEFYLPPYMVPYFYMQLEEFPLNPNGKIDYKLLPEYETKDEEYVEPSGDTQIKLSGIIKKILGIEKVSAITPLNILGFSSLSYVALSSQILDEFGVEYKLTDLLRGGSTVKSISDFIDNYSDEDGEDAEIENMDRFPMAPQIYQFIQSGGFADQYRKFIINKEQDANKVRKAFVKCINTSTYMFNSFEKVNDNWYQIPHRDEFITEDDIEIVNHEISQEDEDAFLSLKAFNIKKDKRLWNIVIFKGDKVTVLMRLHHSLIDNVSIDAFLKDIQNAILNTDDGDTQNNNNDRNDRYYVYSLKMDKYYKANKTSLDEKRINLLSECGIRILDKPTAAGEIKTKKFFIKYNPENTKKDRKALSPANYCFGLLSEAFLQAFDKNKILINYFFGGRNEAKYSKTIGYFPYRIPIKVEKADVIKGNIEDIVINAIVDSNPYGDETYHRIVESQYADMYIEYNCMNLVEGGEDVTMTSLVKGGNSYLDPEIETYHPDIRITAFVQKDGIILGRIDYDSNKLTEENAESVMGFLKNYMPTS